MREINKYITNLLIRLLGIDVSKYDESFLSKSIEKRISDTQCSSLEEYCTLLEQNNSERNTFVKSLNINYSEFFRNSLTFALLKKVILPSLIHKKKNSKRKEIRIWSAACASGQEAYSIAILLEELRNGNTDKFSYRIFATDQSELQVDKARKGVFTSDEINNLSMKRAAQFFDKHGENYFVKPELKDYIHFSVFDILNKQLSVPAASIFGEFDLVFCANLLFYYQNKYREIIVNKIGNSLTEGGFLVTGEAEREILMNHNYNEVYSQSCIFQR